MAFASSTFKTSVVCAGSKCLVATPSRECAATAIRQIGEGTLAGVRDKLVGLVTRVNLSTTQAELANKLIEPCVNALCISPTNTDFSSIAGQLQRWQIAAANIHDAGLLLLAVPVLYLVNNLTTSPLEACAQCGVDGTLLSVCTTQDGLVQSALCHDLGMDEHVLEPLVLESRQKEGHLNFNPLTFRPEKLIPALLRAALDKLMFLVATSSKIPTSAALTVAGIQRSTPHGSARTVTQVQGGGISREVEQEKVYLSQLHGSVRAAIGKLFTMCWNPLRSAGDAFGTHHRTAEFLTSRGHPVAAPAQASVATTNTRERILHLIQYVLLGTTPDVLLPMLPSLCSAVATWHSECPSVEAVRVARFIMVDLGRVEPVKQASLALVRQCLAYTRIVHADAR
jgi:hypothetical protein